MPRLVVPGRELSGPGEWPAMFGRSAPLVVEIGFGKDTFLLDRAAACPDDDHVGVERDPERVKAFLREAELRALTNVRAMPVSAELALGHCFEDGAVAELHVYFPDPISTTSGALRPKIERGSIGPAENGSPYFGNNSSSARRCAGVVLLWRRT